MVETVDDIFEAFGGPSEVGAAVGIPRQHAGTMKTRGSIPSEYWSALVDAAARRNIEGVTLEALARIAARKGKATSAASSPTTPHTPHEVESGEAA